MKELDARALKTLSTKINVIPIIAKADTMTVEEKVSFKSILLRDLEDHHIKTFPSSYSDEVDGAEDLFVSSIADFGGVICVFGSMLMWQKQHH